MTEKQVLATLEEFKAAIIDLKTKNLDVNEKCLSYEKSISEAEEQAKKYLETISNLRDDNSSLVSDLEKANKAYEDKCEEMKAAVDKLVLKRAEVVSAEIVRLKHNTLETIKAYNSRIDSKDAEIKDLKAVINRLKGEIKKSKEAMNVDEKESLAKTLIDASQPQEKQEANEEPKTEELETKEVKDEAIHFRFATSTQKIADDFVKFIHRCINDEGPFAMSPEVAAVQLGLPIRERDSFIKHLSELQLKDKPLIAKARSGIFIANFNAEIISKFVTEVIS